MKISKSVIIFLYIILSITLYSVTLEVKQDGSGDYLEIQAAVNSSVNGDTVLVYPGTYFENIDINGKELYICSLEAITGDSTYIDSTIVNGDENIKCFSVMYDADVTIRGLSLTNAHVGIGSYQANLNLISCNVFDNFSQHSAGISYQNSTGYMENVNVYNNISTYTAGGMKIEDSNIVFSEENRCSIYNNRAASGLDIRVMDVDDVTEIYLDKVSFADPFPYFIATVESEITLNYLQYENESIDADLYVSPEGSDANSGLTAQDPLQTINFATYYQQADSLNPKTIHLLPGEYTPDNQQIPISIKGYTTLQGAGIEETRFDFNDSYNGITFIADAVDEVKITDLSFTNFNRKAITIAPDVKDIFFRNLKIDSTSGNCDNAISSFNIGDFNLSNVEITNCNSSNSPALQILKAKNVYIDGYICRNNHDINEAGSAVNQIRFTDNCVIENSIFTENTNIGYDEFFNSGGNAAVTLYTDDNVQSWKIANSLFYGNQAFTGTAASGGHIIQAAGNVPKAYFINNTIIDNVARKPLAMGSLDGYVYNNVFYNSAGSEIYVYNSFQSMFHTTLTFSHNLIDGGIGGYQNGYPGFNEETWLTEPIDADPMLDSLNAEWPFFPLAGSPVIDAGTTELPDGLVLPEFDLAGNPRIYGDTIDLGCYEWSETETPEEQLTIIKAKLGNYPNPFNPETTISMSIPNPGRVELEVYNIKGQLVKKLMDAQMEPGVFAVNWNGKDNYGKKSASGTYIARCSVNGTVIGSQKMTLLK